MCSGTTELMENIGWLEAEFTEAPTYCINSQIGRLIDRWASLAGIVRDGKSHRSLKQATTILYLCEE